VELGSRSDLVVSLGGDGTMLRAMRLADRQRAPVLGVNLGKLGFLAEVDVPALPDALSAIDDHEFTIESRVAVDADYGGQTVSPARWTARSAAMSARGTGSISAPGPAPPGSCGSA